MKRSDEDILEDLEMMAADDTQIRFIDQYDDDMMQDYFAGYPEDYSLRSLLMCPNASFWDFSVLGFPSEGEGPVDCDGLMEAICNAFRIALQLFDDDLVAIIKQSEVNIANPLMDMLDEQALDFALEIRALFFVENADGERMAIVPLELRDIYQQEIQDPKFDERRQLASMVVTHAQGMTILDGIVLIDELAQCIENNIAFRIPALTLELIMKLTKPFSDLVGFQYNDKLHMLSHASLVRRTDIADLWSRVEGRPAFLPDIVALQIARVNPFYPLNEAFEEFGDYVLQWHFDGDDGEGTLFLLDFGEAVSMGANIQDLMDLCDEYDMNIEEDFDKFMKLVAKVMNNSRRWDLRGFSPDELSSL